MAQTPAQLTPLASPLHFLGAELRHWRQRRNLSQAELGRMVHISADLICKLEKAVRWPARSLMSRCDAVLDTGGLLERLLGLAERYRATDTTLASLREPVGTTIPVVVVVGREILPGLLLRHVADKELSVGVHEQVR